MIIYVKWIFAALLTVPMLVLGLILLRQFNIETRNLRTQRAARAPAAGRKKPSSGKSGSRRVTVEEPRKQAGKKKSGRTSEAPGSKKSKKSSSSERSRKR